MKAFAENDFAHSSANRNTLLYFVGSSVLGNKVWQYTRAVVMGAMADEPDCVVVDLTGRNFEQSLGMRQHMAYSKSSIFMLVPPGDPPTASRYIENFISGAIPVVVSDRTIFPFGNTLDYSEGMLWFWEEDVVNDPKSMIASLRWLVKHYPQRVERMHRFWAKHVALFHYGYTRNQQTGFSHQLLLELAYRKEHSGVFPAVEPLMKHITGFGFSSSDSRDSNWFWL
jgi:hypothetical protein